MKCFWTHAAEDDRHAIWYWNMNFGLEEANRIDLLIEEAVTVLSRSPYIGNVGRYPETFELTPEPTFRVIYFHRPEGIFILAVMHAAFALADIGDPRLSGRRYGRDTR